MKNLLFITQFFFPDVQATSQMFTQLVEDVSAVHEVKVVAGCPLVTSEGEDIDNKCFKPKRYKLIHTPNLCLKRKRAADRVLNHLSFSLIVFFRLLFRIDRGNTYIITSDNPFAFIYGVLLPKEKTIYLCQDIYYEQVREIYRKKTFIIKTLKLVESLSARCAGTIITISREMKSFVEQKFSVPSKIIKVISNWADVDRLMPTEKKNYFSERYKLTGKFVVMHAGRLGLTQDIDAIIDAAAALRDREDMVFVIIGEGARKDILVKKVRMLDLQNVLFLPYQDKEMLKYTLSTADVGLIMYKGDPSRGLVPSRLFSFMACGVPIISNVNEGTQASAIIKDASCGILMERNNVDELKEAILYFKNNKDMAVKMGLSGRSFIETRFNRKQKTCQYVDVIDNI